MKKTVFTLLLLASAMVVFAQSRRSLSALNKEGQWQKGVVQAYIDSLKTMQVRLDSMYALGKYERRFSDVSMSRLLLPVTFYSDVTGYFLRLDTVSTEQSDVLGRALMSVYLNRPDLVETTSNALDIIGTVIDGTTNQQVTPINTVNTQITTTLPAEITPATVAVVVKKPNFWSFGADTYMQFIQNYVSSNWYKGGQSNYSMVSSVTLQANYNNKQKVKWENKLEMKLGFQTTHDDTLHSYKTSEDLLRYTGKLGLQASKRWYYTLQAVANTQFMRGYNTNNPTVFSDFASPFNLNISFGMDYSVNWFKGKVKGSIHLAPLAYNFKYVSRLALSKRYGVDAGHHSLGDKGSTFTIDVTTVFSPNVKWKTRMWGYTTYERSELEWENTFSFQLNRYISTNLFLYPRFDDGAKRDHHHGYFQFKEYAFVGLSYSF